MSSDLLEYIIQRLEKIDGKVDKLLEFKWQIIGGSAVISVFVTLAIQLLINK